MLVILTIVYISCWAVHGKDYFIEIAGGGVSGSTSIPVIIITDSFAFAAGLEALIFGVKMMVKGLVEPLEGISRRAIPNAKMCIDSAVIIDKQPTAVLIAFISSLTGGLLVTGLSFGLAKLAPAVFTMIMIPSLPTHFLSSGACGIMANSRGGIKACIIAPFLCGIIFSFMPLVFGIIYNTMGDGFGNIPQISDIRINNPSD
jgi:PTS system ascorbate-specific IIC component